jgi:hypothetical protein
MRKYQNIEEVKNKNVKVYGACWVWQGARNGRYGWVSFRGIRDRAHRIFYRAFRGPIPKDTYVCHKCDRPTCVNPNHLFLGTQKDNMRDMVLKGRSDSKKKRGELNGRAVLNKKQVLAIRKSLKTHAELAREFGVGATTIMRIRQKNLWNHVP